MILEVAIVELNIVNGTCAPNMLKSFKKDIVPHESEMLILEENKPIVLAKNGMIYLVAKDYNVISGYLCGISDTFSLIHQGFWPSNTNPVLSTCN